MLIILQVLVHCVQGGSAQLKQLCTQQGKGLLCSTGTINGCGNKQFRAFCNAGVALVHLTVTTALGSSFAEVVPLSCLSLEKGEQQERKCFLLLGSCIILCTIFDAVQHVIKG